MNRQFLDTSYVIALVNDKDSYFSKAQELLPSYVKNYLITTDAVLFEIGNALAKAFERKQPKSSRFFATHTRPK